MWQKRWARFKLLRENMEEAKSDPKGSDKLMRRDVEKDPSSDIRADPLISDWCQQFGYFPYQTMKNEWNPFLGQGAQGRVYCVTKNGKLYAVKLVSKSHGYGAESEWETRNRFAAIYTNMPEHIRKHFPKIFDMGEYDANENVAEEGNSEYYYYVMEYLQPLDARYAKYFQGEEGRGNAGPFPVRPEEYDIFRTERYGDVLKAYNMLIDTLSAVNVHYGRIFLANGLEIPIADEKQEALNLIKELANEILYETWSRDIKKSFFKSAQTETDIASMISNKMLANYKKKDAAVKKLAAKLADRKLKDLPYGPNIIKKMRELAIELALPELNKFMAETFNKFGKYVAEQSIPHNYLASGEPGLKGWTPDSQIDVDLLRSGPVTEFREAMIHAARNYDLKVIDIKAANVMQRGKDLVMVDIGVWGAIDTKYL